jgi:hypothetical protein
LVRNDEVGDFLKGLRHSLHDLIPALASIVDMLTLMADDMKKDNFHLSEVQRLEGKMQAILTTAREITLEKQRTARTETDRLMFARN